MDVHNLCRSWCGFSPLGRQAVPLLETRPTWVHLLSSPSQPSGFPLGPALFADEFLSVLRVPIRL